MENALDIDNNMTIMKIVIKILIIHFVIINYCRFWFLCLPFDRQRGQRMQAR